MATVAALHECVRHSQDPGHGDENRRVLASLIERGADVNALSCGTRPLHIAATFKTDEVAQVLLQAGADPRLKDSEKRTPMDVAASLGNESTRRILLIRAQELHIEGLEEELIDAFNRLEELEYPNGRSPMALEGVDEL